MALAVRTSTVDYSITQQARLWMEQHMEELKQRAAACFGSVDFHLREEAIAEAMAMIYAWTVGAARRGVLANLTPYWCVIFAYRQYRAGRRFAGYSATCVMSEAALLRGRSRRVAMNLESSRRDHDDLDRRRWGEALATSREDDPFEIARRNLDYPEIMEAEQVSPKARATMAFLAETHGSGKQCELAATLMVSPGRVSQLKDELAEALARHGYHPLAPEK